jgi:hypothetical protein
MIEAGLGRRKLSKFGWVKCQLMTNVTNYCLFSFRIKHLNDICLKVFIAILYFFLKENGLVLLKKIEFIIHPDADLKVQCTKAQFSTHSGLLDLESMLEEYF